MATYSSTKEECFWSVWLFPVTPSMPLSALISCIVSLFFHIFLKVLRLPIVVSGCLSRLLLLKLPSFSSFCNSFTSSVTCFFPLQETSATPLGSSSPIIKLIPIELLRCPPDKGPCFMSVCQARCGTGFNTTRQEGNTKKGKQGTCLFSGDSLQCGRTAKMQLCGMLTHDVLNSARKCADSAVTLR